MAISHDDLMEFLADELQELSLLTSARPNRKPHLDESDDDYKFVEDNLERWGDRRVPHGREHSIHVRLELEADRILAEAA